MTYSLEQVLDALPSRIYARMPTHEVHQLVIEKFPDGNWCATYVCMGCKGKTMQVVHPDLDKACIRLKRWADEVVAEGHFHLL